MHCVFNTIPYFYDLLCWGNRVLHRGAKYFGDNGIYCCLMIVLMAMFVLPLLLTPVLDIGMSIGRYFGFFILGYLFLSIDSLLEKLDKYRIQLLIISMICMIGNLFVFYLYFHGNLNAPMLIFNIFRAFYGWVTILAILESDKQSVTPSVKSNNPL